MSQEVVKMDISRPSRQEAEDAVGVLLRYIGENPERSGLLETPARVIKAYDEFFQGYEKCPEKELTKTFDDIADFDDIVLVKNIDFISHCEHHIVPIIGKAHVAYWPDEKVVGISKLARVVDVLAKRLTSQENMTRAIVKSIENALAPKGVAVIVDADHQCMSIRGVHKSSSSTITCNFSGIFKDNDTVRARFMDMVRD